MPCRCSMHRYDLSRGIRRPQSTIPLDYIAQAIGLRRKLDSDYPRSLVPSLSDVVTEVFNPAIPASPYRRFLWSF